ncbi:hypothetical protein Pfo_016953 [Paulownia fortunei]|nr:hypothetical protein Pfo_016953 [Paulownia fortunei]
MFSVHVLLFAGLFTMAPATLFTLKNSCTYTVWPGTLSGNGAAVGEGGFALAPGETIQLPAPQGWSGRFWARTGCNFDDAGNGQCTTGDCGGKLKCTGSGAPPASLVEFTIGNGDAAKDFYDVSLVDGYNVGLSELQVVDDSGRVVACKSACVAFHKPEYCCTGDHSNPQTCPQTSYSQMFKKACPTAYSYAYDDKSSICTCTGCDYFITFCPST